MRREQYKQRIYGDRDDSLNRGSQRFPAPSPLTLDNTKVEASTSALEKDISENMSHTGSVASDGQGSRSESTSKLIKDWTLSPPGPDNPTERTAYLEHMLKRGFMLGQTAPRWHKDRILPRPYDAKVIKDTMNLIAERESLRSPNAFAYSLPPGSERQGNYVWRVAHVTVNRLLSDKKIHKNNAKAQTAEHVRILFQTCLNKKTYIRSTAVAMDTDKNTPK